MSLRFLAILRNDWKWYAALAVFMIFTAFVVRMPRPPALPAPPGAASGNSPSAQVPDAGPPDTHADSATVPDTDWLDYTVQDGDTIESIAQLFVIRAEDFCAANGLLLGEELSPGRRVRIPPLE